MRERVRPVSARDGNTCNNRGDRTERACARSFARVHFEDMRNVKAALVVALVACGAISLAIGCSSSSDTGPASDAGGGGDVLTSGDAGGGGGDGGGGGREGGTLVDAGDASSGFGAACAGPAGQDGGCADSVYNACEMVGPSLVCTKACTYPGGGGPQPDPTDCPSPPTSGDCTPKGFCK